ncbi:MAG: hypothetical protein V3V31_16205 [Methylococcales bacterium]
MPVELEDEDDIAVLEYEPDVKALKPSQNEEREGRSAKEHESEADYSVMDEDLGTVFKAITNLPENEQEEVYIWLSAKFEDKAQIEETPAEQPPPQELEEPEKPDISAVPLWRGKVKDGPAIDWLKTHYGQWLKCCGADKNYIYRQDILDHDPKLARGISREANILGKNGRKFIPTDSDELDNREEQQGITEEVIRTVNAVQRRVYRKKESPTLQLDQ